MNIGRRPSIAGNRMAAEARWKAATLRVNQMKEI